MIRGFFTRAAHQVRRDERGFTLVEMLTTVTLGLIITFAGYMAIDAATKVQLRTEMRVEAIARGRGGMEAVTRAVRSQQCYNGTRPMLWASDAGMEFYASIAPLATTTLQPVERHRIEWVAKADSGDIGNGTTPTNTTGDIVETVWRMNSDGSWPARNKPTTVSIVATGVEVATDRRDSAKTAPIFRYFKYAASTGSGRVDLTAPVGMTNSAITTYNTTGVKSATEADLSGIVLIEVSYKVTPRRTRAAMSKPVNFYNTVSVRIADPTNPGGSPQCL